MIEIKKRYYWKELSEKGILEDPEDMGRFDPVYLNGDDGFETEDIAEDALIKWYEKYQDYHFPPYFLICECSSY